ncbi:MAG TPA: hypothetical protein PK668_21225 [Myxococcota bacterium]|nr:hypothetical protein [Myxococcota bacterium]HRY95998.1 hypothetical protein [Myxococcota bacterium]HSA21794.1 hypothetical protein [Myxococcota bacterium]
MRTADPKRWGHLFDVIVALGVTLCVASCDICGIDQRRVSFLDFKSTDFRVTGQSLYPEELDNPVYEYWIDNKDATNFEVYHRLFKDPSSFSGEVPFGCGAYLGPPWCEDTVETREDCARVGFGVMVAGPQVEGDVHDIVHGEAACISGGPAACASFIEEPIYKEYCEFPEYKSTTAIGTASVVSEHPFTIAFEVEFRDEANAVRNVTATFSISGYREECMADDW